jgi:hypothetical protein
VAAYEEDRRNDRSGILPVLIGSLKRDPFETGVVRNVLLVRRDASTFKLPTTCDIVDVVECFTAQNQRE